MVVSGLLDTISEDPCYKLGIEIFSSDYFEHLPTFCGPNEVVQSDFIFP